MNILLCIFTVVVFPRADGSELIAETSLNPFTFTPRWSIEPYPGYQVFLANRVRFAHAFPIGSDFSMGAEAGVASRFHLTYFKSYGVWGVDDTRAWLMLNSFGSVSLLVRAGLPTGRYDSGIGTGAYSLEIYTKKADIMRFSSACIGYEWVGTNPDQVNYGDKIHFGLELLSWLRIHCHYAFADQGAYFSLYDSPSFGIEISVSKNFRVLQFYNLAAVFSQTILGKDNPVTTGISLRMSRGRGGG